MPTAALPPCSTPRWERKKTLSVSVSVSCRRPHDLDVGLICQDRLGTNERKPDLEKGVSLLVQGKRLIVSLKNGFIGSAPIAAKFKLCAVPLDSFIAGMRGEKFIRFHEYFGALQLKGKKGPSGIDGSTMCNNLIRTAQVTKIQLQYAKLKRENANRSMRRDHLPRQARYRRKTNKGQFAPLPCSERQRPPTWRSQHTAARTGRITATW